MLLIIIAITSALSQDLSGVWYGNAKNPDDKEIVFENIKTNIGMARTFTPSKRSGNKDQKFKRTREAKQLVKSNCHFLLKS